MPVWCQLEARLWKDNAYFLAGEIKYNLEFGEAMGVELDQGYAVRVRAINAAGTIAAESTPLIMIKL